MRSDHQPQVTMDRSALPTPDIIDPTKMVRTALLNTASIGGLMLTTEAMVAEKADPVELRTNLSGLPCAPLVR